MTRAVSIALALALAACAPPASSGRCPGQRRTEVSTPADDAAHAEPTEWWYWSGHLQDVDGGGRFGFQVTFFSFSGLMLSNVALSDLDGGAFHHDAAFQPGTPPQVQDGFQLALGNSSAQGGDGHDALHASFDGVGFDLRADDDRAPVMQFGTGREDFSFGGFSYYYSRPRMAASGTVTVGGASHAVQGTAWFDHQWGELSEAESRGWDWFALQLDDGRNVMLFILHGSSGPSLLGGSIDDGSPCPRQLGPGDVAVTSTGNWTSPASGCTYPSGWRVQLLGQILEVTPNLLDQELYVPQEKSRSYWEGDSTVTGAASGRAYVELTGYCP